MRFTAKIRKEPSRSVRKRKLTGVPGGDKPRTAQITAGVLFDATYFPAEHWDELEDFRPEMLVGAAADLQWLAERMRRGELHLQSVDRAVFALTLAGDAPVSDTLRVVLWQAFGVPVYELFVSTDGTVLAAECEAHEGWHVEPGCRFYYSRGQELVADSRQIKGIRTGLAGMIKTETCVCGRAGMRLMDVRLHSANKNKVMWAAIA